MRQKFKRSATQKTVAPKITKEDPRFNTALARGLSILRAFRPGDTYLGNVELAERTGIPNSTISRFTFTLQELGYLIYIENLGRYQLGPRVLDLGFGALATIDIQVLARPLMTALASECGGLVSLAVIDDLDMVYIEVARGLAPIMRTAYVGMRIPVPHTSLGWACIAGMEQAERDTVMEHMKSTLDSDWPQVRRQMLDAFDQVKAKGFCMNFGGRFVPAVNAVAAPVRSFNDARRFAFNLTAPGVILSKSDMTNVWGPKLAALAQQVEGTNWDQRSNQSV